ncbi:tyrosine-type recombinase/integrase [Bradyrhizobium sp. RDT46]|uniref:tyrosine-type recombinase/integrase n=1 Tax=Bradyrhizobium sp. RDT46 TaxID=3341829 RepID=UPI0035C76F52
MLTAAAVRKYKSSNKTREISDGQFGLRLLIHPKFTGADGKEHEGRKSWIMRFRRPDGKHAKLTLGVVDISDAEPNDEPVIGGPLTLPAARQLAAKVNRDRARDVDVVAEEKAKKERKRAVAQDAAENTFGKLVVEFIREHRVRKWGTRPRRWRETAVILGWRWPRGNIDPAKVEPEMIKGGLADKWRDKPVDKIDDHDIHTQITEARKLGIPGLGKRNKGVSDNRGRKMFSALSTFFGWAKRERRIRINPVLEVTSYGPPQKRQRAFTDIEIKLFWQGTEEIPEPFRSALRVLLLTGQRLKEVTGMMDQELGGFIPGTPADLWTLGPDRTKNHLEHHVPLSSLVRNIIDAVPRAVAPRGQNFSFVFSTTGSTPITGFSKMKKKLDKAIKLSLGEGESMPAWRLHDLRRTAATGMQRLGIRPEVTERALNHVSGIYGGIVGTYQTDPLAAEVKIALERWSQHVAGLIEGGDKVVPLRTEAK